MSTTNAITLIKLANALKENFRYFLFQNIDFTKGNVVRVSDSEGINFYIEMPIIENRNAKICVRFEQTNENIALLEGNEYEMLMSNHLTENFCKDLLDYAIGECLSNIPYCSSDISLSPYDDFDVINGKFYLNKEIDDGLTARFYISPFFFNLFKKDDLTLFITEMDIDVSDNLQTIKLLLGINDKLIITLDKESIVYDSSFEFEGCSCDNCICNCRCNDNKDEFIDSDDSNENEIPIEVIFDMFDALTKRIEALEEKKNNETKSKNVTNISKKKTSSKK